MFVAEEADGCLRWAITISRDYGGEVLGDCLFGERWLATRYQPLQENVPNRTNPYLIRADIVGLAFGKEALGHKPSL